MNANIQITPATDTNAVNTDHVLTITINSINGTHDGGHRDRVDRERPRQLRRLAHLQLRSRRLDQLHRHDHLGGDRDDGRVRDLGHHGQRPADHPHHQHGRQHRRRRQRQREQALGRDRAPAPSIAITKDPPTQTIQSGGTATWTIVVTNTGDVPLTNVNVTDPADQLREDLQRHPPPWPERARLYLHPGRHHGQHDQRRDRSRDTAHRP